MFHGNHQAYTSIRGLLQFDRSHDVDSTDYEWRINSGFTLAYAESLYAYEPKYYSPLQTAPGESFVILMKDGVLLLN